MHVPKTGLVLDLANMTDHEMVVGKVNIWGHGNPVLRGGQPGHLRLVMRSWQRVEFVILRWGDPQADDWLDELNAHKPLADCQIFALIGDHVCEVQLLLRMDSWLNEGTRLLWDPEVAATVFDHLSLEQRAGRIYGDSQRYRWLVLGTVSERQSANR